MSGTAAAACCARSGWTAADQWTHHSPPTACARRAAACHPPPPPPRIAAHSSRSACLPHAAPRPHPRRLIVCWVDREEQARRAPRTCVLRPPYSSLRRPVTPSARLCPLLPHRHPLPHRRSPPTRPLSAHARPSAALPHPCFSHRLLVSSSTSYSTSRSLPQALPPLLPQRRRCLL